MSHTMSSSDVQQFSSPAKPFTNSTAPTMYDGSRFTIDDSLSRSMTGSGRDLTNLDSSLSSSDDDAQGVFEETVSFRVRTRRSLPPVTESGVVPGRVRKTMSLGSLEFVTQQVHHADEVDVDHGSIARTGSRSKQPKKTIRAHVKAKIRSLFRSATASPSCHNGVDETKGEDGSSGDDAWATRTRHHHGSLVANAAMASIPTVVVIEDAAPGMASPEAALRLASPGESSGGTPGSVFSFVEDY